MTTFAEGYRSLVADVLANGELTRPRGKECLEKRSLMVHTEQHTRLVGAGVNYRLATAYAMAYICGWDDAAWFERFRPGYTAAFSDDGKILHGAYGLRLQRNRLDLALQRLAADPDSRQAVVNIWEAADHNPSKDLPCNTLVHLLQRNGKLHMFVHVRSQDAVWGLPYDHDAWWLVLRALAPCLGAVDPGSLTQYIDSLHVYTSGAGFYDAEKVMRVLTRATPADPKNVLRLDYGLGRSPGDLPVLRRHLTEIREQVESGVPVYPLAFYLLNRKDEA